MSGVKIATLDRLISGDRYDPILIVSKTIGLEWATVRALILLRLGPNRAASPADIEGARVNFARLMPSTAERVVEFWKTRHAYSTFVIARSAGESVDCNDVELWHPPKRKRDMILPRRETAPSGEIEMLTADIQSHANRIRDDGFTVIEHAASPELVEGLKAALERTERDHNLGYAKTSFEGFKTVRINNLLTYDDIFWEVPLHENVLPVVERVLDRECLLSSFCSLVLGPGQEAQPIHEDTQLIPLPRPHIPITINAIWALSDFRQDNGATRIVPGSHKYDSSPEYGKEYDTVTATMPAGSVMLFDSALWHGGGANTSDARRFAFSCAYCWGWMRQQENLQFGIPLETAKRFPRRLQELCGYSVYKGQFGHIDNRDPIELLGRERGKRMVWEATDAKKARAEQ